MNSLTDTCRNSATEDNRTIGVTALLATASTHLWRRATEWRGLRVAELAKSSGFPGKSPEVYATSATNFP